PPRRHAAREPARRLRLRRPLLPGRAAGPRRGPDRAQHDPSPPARSRPGARHRRLAPQPRLPRPPSVARRVVTLLTMAMVSLQKVSLDYGGRLILDEVDLEINRGERVGLVGENGSGKSSLLKLIAGLETPTDGSVTRSRNVTVGYLAQESDLSADGVTVF